MSHAVAIVAVDGDVPKDEVKDAVGENMEPFNEREEWFRDGSRWDYWRIGGRYSGHIPGKDSNIVRKGNIDPDRCREINRMNYARTYERAVQEMKENDDFPVEFLYDVNPEEESMEEFVDRKASGPFSAWAFVQNRTWYEQARLGWFGGTAKTECDAERDVNVCKHEDEESGGTILTYEGETDEGWKEDFYDRFIAPLADDTWLVVVDYHV